MGRAGRGGNGNRELAGIERGETNYKRRVITTVARPHISIWPLVFSFNKKIIRTFGLSFIVFDITVL